MGQTASPAASPSPLAGRTVVYTCEDGERLTANFSEGAATIVDPRGRSFDLKQQVSGSGVWYEGQGHTLRGKGEEMTWTAAGRAPKVCSAAQNPFSGSRWRLVQFHASDGKASAPAAPDRYVMELQAGGQLALQLDCNRAVGRWEASGSTAGSISLDAPAMTRAACPPGSWDTRLAHDLASVHSFVLNGDRLDLALDAGAGVYSWTRLPAAGGS